MDGRTALYRLYDRAGELLYVGITSDPERRFAQHADDKHWWWRVARKRIEWFDKRSNALAAEEMCIKIKDPAYNREHSRHQVVGTVTISLTKAWMDGLEMLARLEPPRRGKPCTKESALIGLLIRELGARGLFGSLRCFHSASSWPDGVVVQCAEDGACPCGKPILPDGTIPEGTVGRPISRRAARARARAAGAEVIPLTAQPGA